MNQEPCKICGEPKTSRMDICDECTLTGGVNLILLGLSIYVALMIVFLA